MATAALCRILTPTPTPTLLLHRQLLLRILSTQPQPVQTTTPAELSRLKSSIHSAATTPDTLASLFLSALPHPAFLADRPLFSLSVHHLASANRCDLVASILSSSLTSLPASHPSEGFLIHLISLYAAAGMPDHSLSTFRLVTPPSDQALSALLSAYHNNRQYDCTIHAIRTLPAELGIKTGIVSHNIVLKSLVAGSDVASARAVFDEMPDKASVEPNIVSCNEILKGYLNSGDTAAFDQLLNEITGAKRRLKPNVSTYNLRMAALCAKGRSFEATELLDAMGAKGIPPNRASFNTVIKGLCKEGEVGAAMALFKRMPEVPRSNGIGVSPNFETYIILLESLVKPIIISLFGCTIYLCIILSLNQDMMFLGLSKAVVDELYNALRLVIDKEIGKPKGYGFCEYKDEETALSARRNLQGYEINGRQLRVDFAENGRNSDRNREKVEDPQFITVEEPYFSPCKFYVKMKACITLVPLMIIVVFSPTTLCLMFHFLPQRVYVQLPNCTYTRLLYLLNYLVKLSFWYGTSSLVLRFQKYLRCLIFFLHGVMCQSCLLNESIYHDWKSFTRIVLNS